MSTYSFKLQRTFYFKLYPCGPQGFEAGVKNWYTVKAPLLLGGVSRSDGVVIIINLISRNHLPLRVLPAWPAGRLLKGGEFFYLLLTIHYSLFTSHYSLNTHNSTLITPSLYRSFAKPHNSFTVSLYNLNQTNLADQLLPLGPACPTSIGRG